MSMTQTLTREALLTWLHERTNDSPPVWQEGHTECPVIYYLWWPIADDRQFNALVELWPTEVKAWATAQGANVDHPQGKVVRRAVAAGFEQIDNPDWGKAQRLEASFRHMLVALKGLHDVLSAVTT